MSPAFTLLSLILPLATEGRMPVSEWYALTSLVGYVLLLIVALIVSVVIVASIFTTPRKSKVTGLFLASIILIVVGAVAFTYLIGTIFSLLVP